MASGGKSQDIKSDDSSIIGISNSQPKTGGRQQQSSHQGPHSSGHNFDRPPQNSSRKQQQKQQQQRYQTPNSSEKRRQDHWKVPHGNNKHSPLARDLFGAESNPAFQFDFQMSNSDHQGPRYNHGYHGNDQNFGGYYSRNNNNQNRTKKNYHQQRQNQNASRNDTQAPGQSSKGNYRHQNGGTPQSKTQNAGQTPKLTNSAPSITERNVQFIETLMKNGQKMENLQVTLTSAEKQKEKKQFSRGTRGQNENSSSTSQTSNTSQSKDGNATKVNKSPANKFINPLIFPETTKKPERDNHENDARSTEKSDPGIAEQLEKEPSLNTAKSADHTESTGTEKNEKKKKKRRQREKKKKRDKERNAEQQETHQQQKHQAAEFRQESQASSAGSDVTANTKDVSHNDKSQKDVLDTSSKPEKVSASEDKELPEKESKEPPVNQNTENIVKKETETENSAQSTEKDEKKKLEELGLEQAELRLEKDMIFKLKKKSPTFPDAKYFCRLCSHHLNTIQLAHKHIKDKRHKKESKAKQQDELLRQLKTPPGAALEVLDRLLVSVLDKNMMTEDGARQRMEVVKHLDEVIREKLPGCSVVPYGSSVTKIGLKTSDVNVDIQYSGDLRTPAVLMSLLKILKDCGEYTDIQEEFNAKVPRIEITDTRTNVRCSLSHNNIKALQTTRLLRIYGEIEPTVIKLGKLLRLWARLCQVDCQQEGSLAPHSFVLMTTFYLQQKYGLPVLHEIMAAHDIESLLEGSDDETNVLLQNEEGDWIYNPTAPPIEEKEEEKQLETPEIEDEIDETAEFTESDDDIEISFGESPKKGAIFLAARDNASDKNAEQSGDPLSPVKLKKCFEGTVPSLAELWLGILKYYSAQFDMENLIITVRKSGKVTRSDRGWSHRRIAIEDPCSPKWNLCKPMNSQALFSYFQTCLKHCVFYFHTAHNSAKPRKNRKISPQKSKKIEKKSTKNGKSIKSVEVFANALLASAFEEVGVEMSHSSEDESQSSSAIKVKEHSSNSNSDVIISNFADIMVDDILNGLKELDVTMDNNEKQDMSYESCYKFTKSSLTDGKSPVIICGGCKKEGHRKSKCPDEVQIKISPLPPFTERLKRMLDAVCRDMYDYYVPQEDEVRMREKVCSDLLDYLRKNYSENVQMCLFGSSRNRFTFRGSDLDICMTFKDNETGEFLDFTSIIEELAKVLRKDPELRQIIPITTAKVPIVKFYHPYTCLEGDISLYNLLAQRNTSMLALYATIDERCRMLGYAMKAFVKRCCIGDASRGSLSSYAYTLLVIYFLQQRDPPVLPVLQELYPGEKSPEHIVDGWNSWFYDSIGNLSKDWPEFGKNKESLGELWLGLLRFYTEQFDLSHHVASIRQKKLLTAFEKEWTSKCICIEDPFDLNHNLGAGVSRKMTNFIMKVFVKARERFGTDPGNQLNSVRDYQRYFFNAEFLMDGQEVPNDRCCRICGKIGHFVKDCPKRRNGRENKLKEVECFACGKKGHFKKDCPGPKPVAGSPMKDHQLQHHLRLMMPQQFMIHHHPVIQNMSQRPPVVIQAKRQDPSKMNFQDSRVNNGRQNSNQGGTRMHENPLNKAENSMKRHENQKRQNSTNSDQNYESHSKTPQSNHKRQQNKNSSTPQNNASSTSKSPHPSSGAPNSRNKQTPGKGMTPKQVNRDLAADFGPTHFNESKQKETSGGKKADRKRKFGGDSPAQGAMQTVQQIESQMIEKERNSQYRQLPKPGDNLNHLIPRQTSSNEEIHHNQNPAFQGYPTGYGQSPNMPQFSPLSPPNFSGYLSQSPRNSNNQNPFQFGHGHDYRRTQSNEPLSRTPPTPVGYNYPYSQSPGDRNPFSYGVSPPSPGYGFHPPSGGRQHQGRNIVTPDPKGNHIASRTFVNSNEKNPPHGGRSEHYNAPNTGPPFYGANPHGSYPPNRSHPQQGQYWS